MPNSFLYTVAAIFGLLFGSFANVLILRDDRRESILTGRSSCPHCKHVLAWYELVPVLSFIVLGGRCLKCKKAISWQYPLVEVAAALLAMLALYLTGGVLVSAALLFFGLLLFLVISGIDVRSQTVWPEYAAAAGLLGGLAGLSAQPLLGAAVGAATIVVIMIVWRLTTKTDGMGEGDVWIAAAVGAVVGFPNVGVALVVAIFAGAIVGSVAIGMRRSQALKLRLPFGPFLFFGLLVASVWGERILNWYLRYSGFTY